MLGAGAGLHPTRGRQAKVRLVLGALVHHFEYRGDALFVEDVDVTALADRVGTPFYVYSAATLRRHVRVMREAFSGQSLLIAYAMKALSNQAVLTLLAKEGVGADVVSGGELERAVAAGIAPEKIVFSGVGKTVAEMRRGLELGIKCFNLESEPELERLNMIAGGMGKIAPVSVRINPDVDAETHAKISTGKAENKFGIPHERARAVYARIAELEHLKAVGVDMHIGSQITSMGPFDSAFALLAELSESDVPLTIVLVQGRMTEIVDGVEVFPTFEPLRATVRLGQDRREFNAAIPAQTVARCVSSAPRPSACGCPLRGHRDTARGVEPRGQGVFLLAGASRAPLAQPQDGCCRRCDEPP